jgi:hypothetical protein
MLGESLVVKVITHPVFGDVAIDPAQGVAWHKQVLLSGRQLDVRLIVDDARDANVDTLDVLAPFVARLADFDAVARDALKKDHRRGSDSNVLLYREHHLEELSADQVRAIFSQPDESVDIDRFLSALYLLRVSLHAAADACAVFDYTISKDATQYVLAVRFDRSGAIAAIEMES